MDLGECQATRDPTKTEQGPRRSRALLGELWGLPSPLESRLLVKQNIREQQLRNKHGPEQVLFINSKSHHVLSTFCILGALLEAACSSSQQAWTLQRAMDFGFRDRNGVRTD